MPTFSLSYVGSCPGSKTELRVNVLILFLLCHLTLLFLVAESNVKTANSSNHRNESAGNLITWFGRLSFCSLKLLARFDERLVVSFVKFTKVWKNIAILVVKVNVVRLNFVRGGVPVREDTYPESSTTCEVGWPVPFLAAFVSSLLRPDAHSQLGKQ